MRTVQKTAIVLISITLPLVAIIFQPNYFQTGFARWQVYRQFDSVYTIEYLHYQFNTVLDFLKLGNTAALDATFYSAEDIWHMVDVQRIYLLVQLTFTAALVLLVLTLIVNRPKGRDHFHYIAKAAALPLVVIVIYSLLNFDSAFILFHKLLFPHNTFWLLDPATSNLIKFLPQELFRELFVLWLISSPLVYLALNRFMLLLDAAPKHAKPVEL